MLQRESRCRGLQGSFQHRSASPEGRHTLNHTFISVSSPALGPCERTTLAGHEYRHNLQGFKSYLCYFSRKQVYCIAVILSVWQQRVFLRVLLYRTVWISVKSQCGYEAKASGKPQKHTNQYFNFGLLKTCRVSHTQTNENEWGGVQASTWMRLTERSEDPQSPYCSCFEW